MWETPLSLQSKITTLLRQCRETLSMALGTAIPQIPSEAGINAIPSRRWAAGRTAPRPPPRRRHAHGTAPQAPSPRWITPQRSDPARGAYLPYPNEAVLRRYPLGLRLAPAVQLHQEMVGVDGSAGRGAEEVQEEEEEKEEKGPEQRRPRRHGPALRAGGGSPPGGRARGEAPKRRERRRVGEKLNQTRVAEARGKQRREDRPGGADVCSTAAEGQHHPRGRGGRATLPIMGEGGASPRSHGSRSTPHGSPTPHPRLTPTFHNPAPTKPHPPAAPVQHISSLAYRQLNGALISPVALPEGLRGMVAEERQTPRSWSLYRAPHTRVTVGIGEGKTLARPSPPEPAPKFSIRHSEPKIAGVPPKRPVLSGALHQLLTVPSPTCPLPLFLQKPRNREVVKQW